MSLSEKIMLAGVEAFIAALKAHLLPIAKVRLLEEQRTKYEETISDIMKQDGASRKEALMRVGEFVPNEAEAEKSFHGYVDNGIGVRLKVAIARYRAKDHIGCLHAISLAIETFIYLDTGNEDDYVRVRNQDNKLFDGYI